MSLGAGTNWNLLHKAETGGDEIRMVPKVISEQVQRYFGPEANTHRQ